MIQAARREKRNQGLGIRLTPSLKEKLEIKADQTGDSMNEIAVRALNRELNGRSDEDIIADQFDQKRCKYLGPIPCGPPAEFLADADDYMVGIDIASPMGIQTGDWVMQADGRSMTGAGINDGDTLFVRPLLPNRLPSNGEIAAVQIHRADGQVEGTIKHWRSGHPHPYLTDGDKNVFDLPDDTERLVPLGIVTAMMRRL